jgi:uncharacterized protein YcgL (UPF0745 family)
MKERLSKKSITREKGYLYYVDKQGDIARVPMKHKRGGKKGKVLKTGIKKAKGYLYFVDKQGFVARAKMSRGQRKNKK